MNHCFHLKTHLRGQTKIVTKRLGLGVEASPCLHWNLFSMRRLYLCLLTLLRRARRQETWARRQWSFPQESNSQEEKTPPTHIWMRCTASVWWRNVSPLTLCTSLHMGPKCKVVTQTAQISSCPLHQGCTPTQHLIARELEPHLYWVNIFPGHGSVLRYTRLNLILTNHSQTWMVSTVTLLSQW